MRARVLAALVAISLLFGGLAPPAHALFGKHKSNVPKVRRAKKNSSPYAYLKPRKPKKPSGYYRSNLSGQLLYGKKKK
jgi:hypothetical protein